MAVYTYKGKSAYIDDRLKRELDDYIISDLKKEDTDYVFCIDGRERSGKSKFADIICGYIASRMNSDYSHENFCLSPQQFRDGIIKADKNGIVVYDEAHKGMGSRRSLSEINNILVDLMMEMGQKNLFVVLVLPTFFMLDKYAAIHRTNGLFHVYKSSERDQKTGKRARFWVFFNEINKIELYIKGRQYLNYNIVPWPDFRGRFYDQWIIDKDKYKEKKKSSFKQHGKRETKAEKWLEQRNRAVYALYKKLDIGSPTLSIILKDFGIRLSQAALQKIIISTEYSINTEKTEEKSQRETEEDDSDEKEDLEDQKDP